MPKIIFVFALAVMLATVASQQFSSPSAGAQSNYQWNTTVDSEERYGDYGYWNNLFGSMTDDDFVYGGRTYEVLYLYWNDRLNRVNVQFDHCVKPSDFMSMVVGSETLTTIGSKSYTDAQCDANVSRNQWFAFHDVTTNPLDEDIAASVRLTLAAPTLPTVGTPSKPTLSSNTASTIAIEWNAVTGASRRYQVQYRPSSESDWTNTVNVYHGTRLVASSLEANTEYKFEVRARGNGTTHQDDWGGWSPTLTARTDSPLCTVTSIGTLSGTRTRTGRWGSDCESSNSSGRYARFYSFRLSTAAKIAIELTSSTDPYLYLLSGSGTSGTVLAEDDDSLGSLNSKVEYDAAAGTYTAEATTFNPDQTGNFSIRILKAPPTPTNGSARLNTTDASLRLSWSRSSGASRYEVEIEDTTYTRPVSSGTSHTVPAYRFAGLRGTQTALVRACNSDDFCSDDLEISFLPPAPWPTNLQARASGSNTIGLTWNSVSRVTGYEHDFRTSTNGPWSDVEHSTRSTSRTLSDLDCGTRYYFRVRAHGDGTWYASEWGRWSVIATTETGSCDDNDPPSFSETSYEFNAAENLPRRTLIDSVVATDADGTVESFRVRGSSRFSINDSGGITVAASLARLDGREYPLTVTAVDDDGAETEVSVAITVTNTVPSAPQDVALTEGNGTLAVTWNAPSWNGGYDITHYRMSYQSDTANRPDHTGWIEASDSPQSHTITSLDNGTFYDVAVQARNARPNRAEEGAWSTTVSGQPQMSTLPTVAAPSPRTKTVGLHAITITWDAVLGALEYEAQHRLATEDWPSSGTVTSGLEYTASGLARGTSYHFRVRSRGNGTTHAGGWIDWPSTELQVPTQPNNCSIFILNLSDGDHSATGIWANTCESTHRPGSYSHYYRFSVAEESTVTINLVSSTDPYLILMNGSGTAGAKIAEDDDSGTGDDSRIIHEVRPGTYTVEATTSDTGETGSFTFTINVVSETPTPLAPPVPTNGAASIDQWDNSSLVLTWSESDGATSYQVAIQVVNYVLTDITTTRQKVDGSAFSGVSGLQTALVRACNSADECSSYHSISFRPPAPAPAVFEVEADGMVAAEMSWERVSGTTGYEHFYRVQGVDDWTWVGHVLVASTSKTVDELACETEYEFRFRMYGDGVRFYREWGLWSEILTATTDVCDGDTVDPPVTPPVDPPGLPTVDVPQSLELELAGSDGVVLQWNVSRYAGEYALETCRVGSDQCERTEGIVDEFYDVDDLMRATEYRFRVQAKGNGVERNDVSCSRAREPTGTSWRATTTAATTTSDPSTPGSG